MTLEQARPSAVAVRESWGGSEVDLGPRTVSPDEARLVRHVGIRLGEQVPAMTEDIVAGLVGLFPRVGPPSGDVAALRNSVHDNMVTMWSMVAHGLEPADVNPPPNALLWPRKMIRARVPLGTLMRVYYVGCANIWHRWVQPQLIELAAAGVDTTVVAARLHSLVFTYLDQAAMRVAEQYHAERLALTGSEDRAQQAAVHDLLAGARVTPVLERAMRFPVDERQRAWILWLPPSAADLAPVLPSLAAGVHALIGGESSAQLTTPHGPTEVWGWTGLAALLVADPPNALRFARRHLGALAMSGERDAMLLTTLRAFLANACSFQHTSATLGVHRNTVLQRIRRCEAELGRPVTSSEPELAAALLILDWLPSASYER
jgi:hypothetical protein